MPDGVNIPGGPSFAGTPQPPDVPCDPTGDGWRGPPGPVGAPGATLVAPTPPAAADNTLWWDSTGGQLYLRYNDGNSSQWVIASSVGSGAFLPLSGGTVTGPLNYTATGGTASISAQNRAHIFLTVDDFGAVGDNSADDSNAFDAYVAYLRAQTAAGNKQPRVFSLGHGRTYYCSRSVDLTGFTHYRFEGNHSVITSGDTTHPAVDLLGSDYCVISNLRILGGSSGAPLLTGIVWGCYDDISGGHPCVTLENIEIDGYFTRACAQNSSSEDNLIINPMFTNRYTAGTAGTNYALIQDGLHHHDLGSRYHTDTRTRDHYFSFLSHVVVAGTLVNQGNGPCVWRGGGSQCHYRGTYMQVWTAQPVCVLYFNADHWGQVMQDFIWEVHSEIAPTNIFLFTGTATNVVMRDLKMSDCIVQCTATGSVFATSGSITRVDLIDCDLHFPEWLTAGSKLFATPSMFTLVGKLCILQAWNTHYNAPSDGHVDFITDDSTGLTLGVYGSISSIYGGQGAVAVNSLTVGSSATLPTTNMTGGLHFGSAVAPGGPTDLSRHIELYGGGYAGFSVTGGSMNLVTGGQFAFYEGSTQLAALTNTGFAIMVPIGFNNHAVAAKPTGYTAPTGTATRATFLTSSVTLQVLAEHVKALIDDLTAYGLIGP